MSRILISIVFVLLSFSVLGQNVLIGVLAEKYIKKVVFAPVSGTYQIYGDSIRMDNFDKTTAICVQVTNDSLVLKMADGRSFVFSEINLVSDPQSYFRISIDGISIKTYDDNLRIRNRFGNILLINDLDMNDYLCGVIEKEAGKKKHLEFYKTQAILCRTYWAKAVENHIAEGYHLCDGVHCQAYMGRSSTVPNIRKAVEETNPLIITDTSGAPVTAVFHGNCGGLTSGAEKVWLKSRPYLKPVKDDYCLSSSGAVWNKTIPLADWKLYLKNCGFSTVNEASADAFSFANYDRTPFYKVGADSISMVKMRTDLKLRSAFFSVTVTGESVVLNGRGYGHGVGMCQEGAMQMARKGFTYQQIIEHYFTGVQIRSLAESDSLTKKLIYE